MKSMMQLPLLAVALLVSGVAWAADEDGFKWGVDVRARYDFTDNMPSKTKQKDYSDYARLRTRLWSSYQFGEWLVYGRLANEFRFYRAPSSNRDKQSFPDVLFVDSLYVEKKNLLPNVDLKLGRQDMKFGKGRIFSDGVGGDGSRSSYFDAARLTWHYGEKSSVDAIALYVGSEDWLPTAGKKQAANGSKADYDPTGFGGSSEVGAGLYWQHREADDLAMDGYVVYKNETSGSKIIGRETYTAGLRVMPQLTETVSAEVEAAVQQGKLDDGRTTAGQLLYGGLTWAPKQNLKPKFTVATLYLSGDKEDNQGKNGSMGWNPVFNRSTGIGELIAPMYSAYRYSNLIYPHLALKFEPVEKHSLALESGPMFTAVEEDAAEGRYKGLFAKAKYTFPIAKHLKGAISLEYLHKGDYFKADARDDAWFTRFELTMKF